MDGMTAYFVVPASPCTTDVTSITLPATPTIDLSMISCKIQVDDKIPKRLGGKDMSMKEINKLRYGGRT